MSHEGNYLLISRITSPVTLLTTYLVARKPHKIFHSLSFKICLLTSCTNVRFVSLAVETGSANRNKYDHNHTLTWSPVRCMYARPHWQEEQPVARKNGTWTNSSWLRLPYPLQWCHNERDGVSNHQPHDFYSSVYSGADQRKHQSSASLAFVRGIHRWPVNSPLKGSVTWKMFPFDDVILLSLSWSHWNWKCLSMNCPFRY